MQDANEIQNQDYYQDEFDGTMYNEEDDDYGQHTLIPIQALEYNYKTMDNTDL
jgi:hypothetical protein